MSSDENSVNGADGKNLDPKLVQPSSAEPTKEVSLETLVSNFASILKRPEDQKAFAKAVSGKATAWEYKHKGSYYKAKYALQFKLVVDSLVKDGKARIYRYKDYPEFSRPRSLYLKIIQSRSYLLDKLDFDGQYKIYCDAIQISTKYNVGVVLSLQRDLLEGFSGDNFHNPSVLADEDDTWREKLDTYLSSPDRPEGTFEATGLALDDNEQRNLEIMLSGLQNISYRITEEKVIVLRES